MRIKDVEKAVKSFERVTVIIRRDADTAGILTDYEEYFEDPLKDTDSVTHLKNRIRKFFAETSPLSPPLKSSDIVVVMFNGLVASNKLLLLSCRPLINERITINSLIIAIQQHEGVIVRFDNYHGNTKIPGIRYQEVYSKTVAGSRNLSSLERRLIDTYGFKVGEISFHGNGNKLRKHMKMSTAREICNVK